ncbi:MAG: diphthine synthase [Candidatus Aenigmarchaeota archaeon]|nr:diphthine synthase [Candidatus Aenigmarchaeota archaeon]
MLYLIGLGLNDEMDLSLKAVEIAKKCDCYVELYTNVWNGSLKGLEEVLGKTVTPLKRKDLEEKSDFIIEEAKEKDVAVFVPGDPLSATTHINLVYDAKRRKIPFKIIHNASIFSAIGETGLQLYKFGKTATIAMSGKLENVKKTIKGNKKQDLHTLLLLDIDREVNVNLTIPDALKMLKKAKLVKETDDLVVFSRAGGDSSLFFDSVRNLINKQIELPAVIIIPGKLHFSEKDFLEMLR